MAVAEPRRLFVGGLPPETTEADVERRFKSFGSIVRVTVARPKNGENGGFSGASLVCVSLFCGV